MAAAAGAPVCGPLYRAAGAPKKGGGALWQSWNDQTGDGGHELASPYPTRVAVGFLDTIADGGGAAQRYGHPALYPCHRDDGDGRFWQHARYGCQTIAHRSLAACRQGIH